MDTSNVDAILKSILPLRDFEYELRKYDLPVKIEPDIASALALVASKIDLLTDIASKITEVHTNQSEVSKQVREIHSVQTGTIYQEPKAKPLNKKQQLKLEEDLKIQAMINRANQKNMNRL